MDLTKLQLFHRCLWLVFYPPPPHINGSGAYSFCPVCPFVCFSDPLYMTHHKILDQTKLKAFADDRSNVKKMIISAFERVEKIVGKGEIACVSNFYFFHNVFKRPLSQMRQKVSLCGNG